MPTKSGPVQVEPERLWRKEFVEEMSFKSGVKDGESEGDDCDVMRFSAAQQVPALRCVCQRAADVGVGLYLLAVSRSQSMFTDPQD